MTEKRFTIDVETENYENAYFENDKFLCYEDDYDAILNRLNKLYEENQSLKKENIEYYYIINCGNCRYHNYDWYDDGDEFEVCDKGNTERLIYNKFCKEWKEL